MEIANIANLTPFFLRLMGITSEEHQNLILDCARKKCHNPCRNDGLCSASEGAYLCKCPTGFTGERCEVDLCYPNPCAHRGKRSGTCQHDVTSGYACTCTPGYEGRDCHQLVDHCKSNPCLHGGTCKRLFNDFRCLCRTHHHGKTCQHKWISQNDYETVKTKLALTLKLFGWKHRGSCLYRAFKEQKTSQDAEKSCVSFNGHLASIHSAMEQQFIVDHVVRGISHNLWIGGSDRIVEGTWRWTDGTPMDYFNWDNGEPNDEKFTWDEDCLELLLRPQPTGVSRWGWNDYICPSTSKVVPLSRSHVNAYVCKVCL